MNDPIGLAGKPLFLDMLKELLLCTNLPEGLDVVTLYEHHIEQSLRRKVEYFNHPEMRASPDDTIANLRCIMRTCGGATAWRERLCFTEPVRPGW